MNVIWSKKTFQHDKLIEKAKLTDTKLEDRDFVRIEITQKDSNKPTRFYKDQIFLVDEEGTLPSWFIEKRKEVEELCRQSWEESVKVNLLLGSESAIIKDDSFVFLYNYAQVELHSNAQAELYDNAQAKLHDNAQAELYGNTQAELYDNTQAELYDNAQAELYDNAQAELHSNAQAELYGNAQAELYDNAQAELYGYAQAKLFSNYAFFVKNFTIYVLNNSKIEFEKISGEIKNGIRN
jgi:hypothetical protein